MNYIEFINKLVREQVLEAKNIVLFGQNINAGSCLAGLTRNLKIQNGGLIINTQNSENTLCGIGFGLMLNGVPSIFFMKQQDFLLLGIDHLVNTYNFIRRKIPTSSFTIMCIIVDEGYQGLQSSLNNFGDFCSIARIPGFAITNKEDADYIIKKQLISPGFRIIGVSLRLFKEELLDVKKKYNNDDGTLFQYREGKNCTVVCFNFSFPYGLELSNRMGQRGYSASLFSVNAATPIDWGKITENIKKTRNLVVIDDSKSANHSYDNLLSDVLSECSIENHIIIRKEFTDSWLWPNPDRLVINYDKIIDRLLSKSLEI